LCSIISLQKVKQTKTDQKKKFFFFCLWGRRLMLFAQSNISNLSYVLLSPKTRTMIFG
jgi:hypothetical protein